MTDSLHVLFSDEGHPVAIRKWSQEPFDDAIEYVRKSDLADLIAACDAALDWADANARWFDISTAPWEHGSRFEVMHSDTPAITEIVTRIYAGLVDTGGTDWSESRFTHWRPIQNLPLGQLPEPLERLGEVLRKVKGIG